MDFEGITVSTLTNLISRTERLQSFTKEKDREPHWDGSIHVYAAAGRREKDTMGRVPLQLKGVSRSRFHPRKPSYPVKISNLRQYLKEGGALYVVGVIDNKGDCQLYYCSLLPYDIKQLLQNISSRQTKRTVPLSLLPTDPRVLENLFTTFLQDRSLQMKIINSQEVLSFTDMIQQKKIYPSTLSLSYMDLSGETMNPGMSIQFPCYLYAEDQNHQRIPVDKIFGLTLERASKRINEPVVCEDQEFYSYYELSVEASKCTIQIGKSCIYISDENRDVSELKFETVGTLAERIHAAKFVIASMKNQGFYVGEHFVDLSNSLEDIERKIVSIENFLNGLERTQEGLKKVGCQQDVDMDQIAPKEWEVISRFSRSIWENTAVPLHTENTNLNDGKVAFYSILTCEPLCFALICEEARHGEYYCKNLFRAKPEIELNGVRAHISPYLLINPENALKCCNFDHEEFLSSLDNMDRSEVSEDRAIGMLLALLSEYDKTSSAERLQEADRISEWLYKNNRDNPNHVYLLNRYQTIFRQRPFLEEEIEKLVEISESSESTEEDKVGAYLLLGNQAAAKIHMKRLTDESRKQLLGLPIAHFLDKEQ